MDERVSVIVLTWNRVDLLRETVDSILNQTYRNLELLIVDNESTDSTPDYVAALDDERVKYFRNPNNGILSVNRNYGIERAGGEYIAFCDDDDLWLPDKLEKQMGVFREEPRNGIVCTNAVYFDERGDIDYLISRKSSAALVVDDFLKGRNVAVVASVLIRAEVFSGVGMYNEDSAIVNTEDLEFMVRVAASGLMIYFLNEPLVRYRIHEAVASHANTLVTINKEKVVFRDLHDKGILNQHQYRNVRRALSKKYAIAVLKEQLKKSRMIKNLVYLLRRVRLRTF